MSNRISAARYARALFDVARKESDPVKVQQDLAAILAAVRDHADLAAVLSSRTVPDDARRKVVLAVAERLGCQAPVGKLLALLAERRRLALLPDVAAVYEERLLDYQNIARADVLTAVPLSPQTQEALHASLARATGRQIEMKVAVNPSLVGGVIARVGSTVYDGSVRTQLKKMRDQLVARG